MPDQGPTDIQLAQIKATMRKLSTAVDGVDHAIALTAVETFAATMLFLAGASDELVAGFCDGVTRGVKNFRAAVAKDPSSAS